MSAELVQAMPKARERGLSARLRGFGRRLPLHLALLLFAILWLAPTVGLLVTSLRPRGDIFGSGWWTAFGSLNFTLENYALVMEAEDFGQHFWNTFSVTIPSVLFPLLIAAWAAYAFAWLRFRFRNILYLAVFALMTVPVHATFVPNLVLASQLGLTQSYLAIWITHSAYGMPFAIFLLRNFFRGIPRDLFEAAKIDGASEWGIFWRIVMPLSVPAIASLVIFQFLWVWNDLLHALIFIQNPNLLPVTVGINKLLSTYGQEWHLLSSAAFISMVVPLIVFFALQRYFVQGILAGAVK